MGHVSVFKPCKKLYACSSAMSLCGFWPPLIGSHSDGICMIDERASITCIKMRVWGTFFVDGGCEGFKKKRFLQNHSLCRNHACLARTIESHVSVCVRVLKRFIVQRWEQLITVRWFTICQKKASSFLFGKVHPRSSFTLTLFQRYMWCTEPLILRLGRLCTVMLHILHAYTQCV